MNYSHCVIMMSDPSRGGLNTHLAAHDNARMFQCGSCDMMFTTAGSARRHMAVHQVSD